MKKENLNQDEKHSLNKTNNSLCRFIKKLDFFSSIKSFVWLAIIYSFVIPFLIGAMIFILYIITHSSPYREPETSALILTLLIVSTMELSFSIGFLIIESRKNIERDFKVLNNSFTETKKVVPSFLLNFLNVTVISITVAILSTKICYELYAFFVINPPIENIGFGMVLGFVAILFFLFTLLLGSLVIYLKQKV